MALKKADQKKCLEEVVVVVQLLRCALPVLWWLNLPEPYVFPSSATCWSTSATLSWCWACHLLFTCAAAFITDADTLWWSLSERYCLGGGETVTSNLSWNLAKGTWPELKEIIAKLTTISTVVAEKNSLSSDNAATSCYWMTHSNSESLQVRNSPLV